MNPTRTLAAASLVAALLAAGCGRRSEPHTKAPTAVRVRAVERSVAAATARYSANILPTSRVDLAFRVGGYVQEIAQVKGVDGKLRPAQEGDPVTRGMELASVRKTDYAQKLGEAKAAHAEALAAREHAQLEFDRAKKLAEANTIAQAALDDARVRLQAATARADRARVVVQEAETALADTTVRAPMDGVIARRGVEVGALAGPGTVAFSIVDTRSVKAVFGVPDTVLETLRLGAPQVVTTEAVKGAEFQGRITRIAQVADPKSRTFEVEINIPNEKQELKAGMVAALKLGEGAVAAASAVVLPLTAIVRSPGKPEGFAVYVVDDKATPPVARVRDVELGEFLGNLIPIKAGLQGGEKVVVMGATLIVDGEAVQIIP
jgi:RND family efflux transporter MFP subunit